LFFLLLDRAFEYYQINTLTLKSLKSKTLFCGKKFGEVEPFS